MPTPKFKPIRGAVAAGHKLTAAAACHTLKNGGNAIDAAIAATFMSFIAEPSLTTICGGGFMMIHAASEKTTRVYDFFGAMPGKNLRRKIPDGLDFRAIELDFGGTRQEFHIGAGAAAVPGNVHGLLTIHQRHGTLPLTALLEPAISAARNGVTVTPNQAFVLSVVRGTVLATAGSRALYAPDGHLLRVGEKFHNPDLATVMESLGKEGKNLFYRGDIASAIVKQLTSMGGLITSEDLSSYRTISRQPLSINYRDQLLSTNPSMGGRLIAFALQLLNSVSLPTSAFSPQLWEILLETMWLTNDARERHRTLTAKVVGRYCAILRERLQVRSPIPRAPNLGGGRGSTTHISVIDENNNAASITTSHGEGNGICIQGTGIILNNLLGEEDINPHGFHQWPPGTRLPSMMSPTMVFNNGSPSIVLGSAGSNRLRTAILQTIIRLIDARQDMHKAVNGPRIHWERGHLDVEPGFNRRILQRLRQRAPSITEWAKNNLFFGGLHAVAYHNSKFCGAGDQRRGGVFRTT